MSNAQNLAVHIAIVIISIFAFIITRKSVYGKLRRVTLAVVLAFVAGVSAWYMSGYHAPHPFLTIQHGPMNADVVFVATFTGLLAIMALSAFLFGGHPSEKNA